MPFVWMRNVGTFPKRLSAVAALALGVTLVTAVAGHAQTTVTTFNFNDSNLVSDGGARSSTMVTSLLNGATQSFVAGTTVNALPGTIAGNALSILTGTGSGNTSNGNGTTLQFSVDTSTFISNLVLSFAVQRSSTAVFATNQLSYSSTGTGGVFTNFGASFAPSVGSYTAQTFDLSSVLALYNNPNVVFRITLDGSVNGSASNSQTLQIDNINLTGVAVPESGTLALLGSGASLLPIGAIAVRRRRNRRS